MSNLFEAVEIETLPNENGQAVDTEIILSNGDFVAVDVSVGKEVNGGGFTDKKDDLTEAYIVMLADGSLKFLQEDELVSEIMTEESPPMSNNSDDNDVTAGGEQFPSHFLCRSEGCNTFHSTQQLKKHREKHAGSIVHKCDYCQKNFSTGYALKAHKRTHTGEKPYTCPELACQKRFKTSGDLHKHIRTHTGERPFKCGICFKAFTTSNIRKVHMRVHTGEKPYQCTHEGCDRRFSSATNYKNHLRIHTGEKPYICSFQKCQKRFTEYSSLYKHYTVHSQKKRYECTVCSKQYRQLSTLNIHFNTIHKDKVDFCDKREDFVSTIDSRPTVYKSITTSPGSQETNVISQHLILHPKNGALSGHPNAISYKGENGQIITSQQFLELQKETKAMKESEIYEIQCDSVSVNTAMAPFVPSPGEKEPKASVQFGSLRTITQRSEAILVLSVPPDKGNAVHIDTS